jgi:uncharacterized protein
MDTAEAITRLRDRRRELERLGVLSLSAFGSRVRGDARPDSDLDLAARIRRDRPFGIFAFVDLQHRLEKIAGLPVDLVLEPARKPRLQKEIDKARLSVF